MNDFIEIVEKGEIYTIIFNRVEKRNALNRAMLAEIDEAIDNCRVRVMIFEGKGGHFCSGLDLHQALDEGLVDILGELFEKIYNLPVVTIASVQGSVMAAGIGIVAACDVAIAQEDSRFAFPEVRRGLIPALVFHLLSNQMSTRALQELFLSGREFSSKEAWRLGLIHHMVSAANKNEFMERLVDQFLKGGIEAQMRIKSMMRRKHPFSLQEALSQHINARNSLEAAEGIKAFEEKRLPRWKRP